MNLARLNHILIPKTADERERWRTGRLARFSRPVRWYYSVLSKEGRVLVILSAVVGAAGLNVGRTQIYLLWCVLSGLLVGTLIWRHWFGMPELRVDARVGRRVMVGKPLTVELELRNGSDHAYPNVRVRRPFLPWDGRWVDSREPFLPEVAPGQNRVETHVEFVRRGEKHLDPFETCQLVPLGLSVGRIVRSPTVRVLVVPRIAQVESLALPLGHRYQPGGVAQASLTGEAREVVGVRPYRPGDPVRDLHARTWARTGQPHVREYQQEYFTRIGVILDTDKSVSSEARFEASISLAAGVMAKLSRGDALIDLLVVGGKLHPFTVGRSLGFLEQALDLLATVEPGAVLESEQLLGRLEPHLAPLSSVVLISQSPDAVRRSLAKQIEARGVPCRSLWVRDDDSATAASPREQVVAVGDIESERPLRL